MSFDAVKNFAKATILGGYGSSDTSITLLPGQGLRLPSAPFNATWYNSSTYADPADDPNREIVRVTAISGDTLTITRNQESTSANAHNIPGRTYTLAAPLTAASIVAMQAGILSSVTSDTNVTGSVASGVLTLGWTGTLAAGRLNSNVVQSVVNDINITGTVSAQALTIGWSGTIAAGRLNSNVVQSVVNDTNITGSIASQALTLGWTGTLAKGRMLGTVVYTDQANTYSSGQKQTFTSSGATAGLAFAGVSADPSGQVNGDIWYRSDLGLIRYYNGSSVISLATGSAITALTGDVLATGPGSVAATVVQINGAQPPASAAYVGTNGSRQIVSATTPLLPANNLSDLSNASTARTNLSLGPFWGVTTSIGTPAQPTVTSVGTNSQTVNYRYRVVYLNSVGHTIASSQMTSPFSGNATLSGSNYNVITPVSPPAGAVGWILIREQGNLASYGGGVIGTSANSMSAMNDQGQTGPIPNGTPIPWPTDDTTVGNFLGAPLVINGPSLSSPGAGQLSIGDAAGASISPPAPVNSPGYSGWIATFLSNGTQNTMLMHAAGPSTNNPTIAFRFNRGSIQQPINSTLNGAGMGNIAGECWLQGLNEWDAVTFYEFGGSTGQQMSVHSDMYGRQQFGVAAGDLLANAQPGLMVGAYPSPPSTFNKTSAVLTNGTDLRLYNTGYARTDNTPDLSTAAELVAGWWNSSQFNFGTVAFGTGTLRTMNLIGNTVKLTLGSTPSTLTFTGKASMLAGAGTAPTDYGNMVTASTFVENQGAANACPWNIGYNTAAALTGSSSGFIAFTSSADSCVGTRDTTLSRASAGVLQVNAGSGVGSGGSLLLSSLIGTALSAPTLANSQFTVSIQDNTHLLFTLKGSDGTVRTGTITVA